MRSTQQLPGLTIRALDGDLGKVADCYFDDAEWTVRYLVVDTGGWLSGRQVLLAPAAIGPADWSARTLSVNLTKEQIENGPDVAADKPVSRQLEEQLSRHFGWPAYWAPTGYALESAATMQPPERVAEKVDQARRGSAESVEPTGDPHLRSMREVSGYHVQATDGEIGHVEDFIVDQTDWTIRFIVVDTRNWLPGRKVLVAPNWFRRVRWDESRVFVDLTREAIEGSPEYDPQTLDEAYVGRLHDYYGRPNRWSAAAAAPVHWNA